MSDNAKIRSDISALLANKYDSGGPLNKGTIKTASHSSDSASDRDPLPKNLDSPLMETEAGPPSPPAIRLQSALLSRTGPSKVLGEFSRENHMSEENDKRMTEASHQESPWDPFTSAELDKSRGKRGSVSPSRDGRRVGEIQIRSSRLGTQRSLLVGT